MKRIPVYSAILTLTVVLAACGKSDGPVSPAAARVDGHDIPEAQISLMIGRGAAVTPEQLKSAGPKTLESLIDQHLLMKKALEGKLDREPQTQLALENARKQVLAQAYMDKVLAGAAKPTSEEVRAFYDKTPLLFGLRRIYRFQELGAAVPDARFDEVNKFAQKAKSLNEIGAWLKSQNLPFKAIESTKAAEELPMELLPNLAKMNDGQIAVLRAPGRVAILQLAQSQQAPLDLAHATQQIEQYLNNNKRLEVANGEVKKLRDAAKIEYVGEFEKSKPAVAAQNPAPAK